jgi:hypothetical protein
MRSAHRAVGRLRVALDRPRFWRVTAALAALLFCVLVVGAAQGSVSIIDRRPTTAQPRRVASWEQWCTHGQVRRDRQRLAYCARVDGIVVGSTHGPGAGETHVAVISDFHLVIVRLPDYARAPSFGSRLTAIGPLVRARDGQREIQAFTLQPG